MTYKECKKHKPMFDQTKPLELLLGTCAAGYGSNLLMPGEVFDVVTYKMMAEIMAESRWGAVATVLGILRVVAVLVNGRVFYSPGVRAILAFASGLFWMVVFTLMIASSRKFGAIMPNGIIYYPIFFVFEGWCLASSAYEMQRNFMLWVAVSRTERARNGT